MPPLRLDLDSVAADWIGPGVDVAEGHAFDGDVGRGRSAESLNDASHAAQVTQTLLSHRADQPHRPFWLRMHEIHAQLDQRRQAQGIVTDAGAYPALAALGQAQVGARGEDRVQVGDEHNGRWPASAPAVDVANRVDLDITETCLAEELLHGSRPLSLTEGRRGDRLDCCASIEQAGGVHASDPSCLVAQCVQAGPGQAWRGAERIQCAEAFNRQRS